MKIVALGIARCVADYASVEFRFFEIPTIRATGPAAWSVLQSTQVDNQHLVVERLEEALREVAVLFIALAPLDVALGAERSSTFRNGLIFVMIGVILFLIAVAVERRRLRG
jgi:hypothetical protein